METIRYKKDGGAVIVHIIITGLVDWLYNYRADDRKFSGESNDGKPHVHTLGMPVELNLDYNQWEVRLINRSDDSQDYKIEFFWTQDNTEIHNWFRKGTLTTAHPAERGTDDAILVETK